VAGFFCAHPVAYGRGTGKIEIGFCGEILQEMRNRGGEVPLTCLDSEVDALIKNSSAVSS
jgi:hypothetical protein